MPDQMDTTLTLLFYRGSGLLAWLERAACRFPCQPLGEVPGHVAVRIGAEDVFEALASGVRRASYAEASMRAGLMREIALPVRTAAQVEAARAYAQGCVGEAYDWREIEAIIRAWAAPAAAVARGVSRKAPEARPRRAAICTTFALLILAHAGCRLGECEGGCGCVPAEATPNALMLRAEECVFDAAENSERSGAASG